VVVRDVANWHDAAVPIRGKDIPDDPCYALGVPGALFGLPLSMRTHAKPQPARLGLLPFQNPLDVQCRRLALRDIFAAHANAQNFCPLLGQQRKCVHHQLM
jgi:hypothetical protein